MRQVKSRAGALVRLKDSHVIWRRDLKHYSVICCFRAVNNQQGDLNQPMKKETFLIKVTLLLLLLLYESREDHRLSSRRKQLQKKLNKTECKLCFIEPPSRPSVYEVFIGCFYIC